MTLAITTLLTLVVLRGIDYSDPTDPNTISIQSFVFATIKFIFDSFTTIVYVLLTLSIQNLKKKRLTRLKVIFKRRNDFVSYLLWTLFFINLYCTITYYFDRIVKFCIS